MSPSSASSSDALIRFGTAPRRLAFAVFLFSVLPPLSEKGLGLAGHPVPVESERHPMRYFTRATGFEVKSAASWITNSLRLLSLSYQTDSTHPSSSPDLRARGTNTGSPGVVVRPERKFLGAFPSDSRAWSGLENPKFEPAATDAKYP